MYSHPSSGRLKKKLKRCQTTQQRLLESTFQGPLYYFVCLCKPSFEKRWSLKHGNTFSRLKTYMLNFSTKTPVCVTRAMMQNLISNHCTDQWTIILEVAPFFLPIAANAVGAFWRLSEYRKAWPLPWSNLKFLTALPAKQKNMLSLPYDSWFPKFKKEADPTFPHSWFSHLPGLLCISPIALDWLRKHLWGRSRDEKLSNGHKKYMSGVCKVIACYFGSLTTFAFALGCSSWSFAVKQHHTITHPSLQRI